MNFISPICLLHHDLSVVKHISDSLGVMYLGTIVERAPKKLLFSNPVHPYTKALFSAAPTIDEGSIAESQELRGEIPSPIHLPSGCPFHDRCPVACPDCAREKPELKEVEPGTSQPAICCKKGDLARVDHLGISPAGRHQPPPLFNSLSLNRPRRRKKKWNCNL